MLSLWLSSARCSDDIHKISSTVLYACLVIKGRRCTWQLMMITENWSTLLEEKKYTTLDWLNKKINYPARNDYEDHKNIEKDKNVHNHFIPSNYLNNNSATSQSHLIYWKQIKTLLTMIIITILHLNLAIKRRMTLQY